ncbi:hypothetical protein MNV49_007218 [Pseudohyphozyma bogoriensis]|nr:hypothetical protein MNV49_007218 [Pseudohyphozyma bogoriensis]
MAPHNAEAFALMSELSSYAVPPSYLLSIGISPALVHAFHPPAQPQPPRFDAASLRARLESRRKELDARNADSALAMQAELDGLFSFAPKPDPAQLDDFDELDGEPIDLDDPSPPPPPASTAPPVKSFAAIQTYVPPPIHHSTAKTSGRLKAADLIADPTTSSLPARKPFLYYPDAPLIIDLDSSDEEEESTETTDSDENDEEEEEEVRRMVMRQSPLIVKSPVPTPPAPSLSPRPPVRRSSSQNPPSKEDAGTKTLLEKKEDEIRRALEQIKQMEERKKVTSNGVSRASSAQPTPTLTPVARTSTNALSALSSAFTPATKASAPVAPSQPPRPPTQPNPDLAAKEDEIRKVLQRIKAMEQKSKALSSTSRPTSATNSRATTPTPAAPPTATSTSTAPPPAAEARPVVPLPTRARHSPSPPKESPQDRLSFHQRVRSQVKTAGVGNAKVKPVSSELEASRIVKMDVDREEGSSTSADPGESRSDARVIARPTLSPCTPLDLDPPDFLIPSFKQRFHPYASPFSDIRLPRLTASTAAESSAPLRTFAANRHEFEPAKKVCVAELAGGTCADPKCASSHLGGFEASDEDLANYILATTPLPSTASSDMREVLGKGLKLSLDKVRPLTLAGGRAAAVGFLKDMGVLGK